MSNDAQSASARGPKLLIAACCAVIVVLIIALPAGRNLLGRFLGSLRMDKPQTVNVDLSAFVGPNSNQTLQQMVTQMISDKVVTTVSEDSQQAATGAAASQIAGFEVHLAADRKDAPRLAVAGTHAFHASVDRSRLQAILDEAGRRDLALPKSIDGAEVSVRIPRSIIARYGNCPIPSSAAANVATPPPQIAGQYSDCVILREGPSPAINVPTNLDMVQLSEIGLQLAGMSTDQAHTFVQNVDWKSMLGLSFPRSMRSYQTVKVNGAPGTLLNLGARRGPTYDLFWAKDGMVYSITGFGDSGEAVKLAESVR